MVMRDKGLRTTAVVVVLPTLISILAVISILPWLKFYSEDMIYIPRKDECESKNDGRYYRCEYDSSLYPNQIKCRCGNLDGVRAWRLGALFLVLCVSGYATRSLFKSGEGRGNRERSISGPGRALSDAMAECRRETGLVGEVAHHNPNDQQPKTVWERMIKAASDPYQQRFYEWALEWQPHGVALGPSLDLVEDVSYPSLSHKLTRKSLKGMSCIYVGNSIDSSKCWVYTEGRVGTLAGHSGLFLTNVGMVKFTRLQYRSNNVGLPDGSWVVINNQASEEDISEATVATLGWTNTLLSLVGFVAGGSSAWSASLGINAATEILAGLIYTIARGNGPRHERIKGYVDPMLSSLRGPALVGSWAWAILSLETLGAILSLFSLSVGGNGVAAQMALLVGLTGTIGTLPSMSGRVALVGSMLSWYSTEFVVEVYGLISTDENFVVKVAFATGAIESCILLTTYYRILSCANAVSNSPGVEAVVRLGNLGITAIPAVGLVPKLRGSCNMFGLRASVRWPRGRVRSSCAKDLTLEGLATGTEIELHDHDVPDSGYEAYVLGPSLPMNSCSTRGWHIPPGWGGYGCVVVGTSFLPVLSSQRETI